jgi:hypothetical protein
MFETSHLIFGGSMVTSLSALVEAIQGSAIPAWMRDYFTEHREQIMKALRENGEYTFTSPENKETITIRTEKAVAA